MLLVPLGFLNKGALPLYYTKTEHAPNAEMLKLQVRILRPFLKNGVMNICMMFSASLKI